MNARVNVVGYCLGGTLSLLYTALYPESVTRLVLLTTTVDGDVQGGIAWVAHQMGLAGESYDNPRLVPAVEVKSWFEMLSPGSNSLMGRVNDLWDRLDDPPERLRDVRTMATWVDDVLPAPGRLLAELYQQFGPGRNKLMAGTATIGDRRVGPGRRHDARHVRLRRERHDRAARRRGRDQENRPARTGDSIAGRARRHRRRAVGPCPVAARGRVPEGLRQSSPCAGH